MTVALVSERGLAEAVFKLVSNGSIRELLLPLDAQLAERLLLGDVLAKAVLGLTIAQDSILSQLRRLSLQHQGG